MCDYCGWEQFVEAAQELLEDIEELPSQCRAKESWVDLVAGMCTWAETRQHCTDAQGAALHRIRAAVDRWTRD